jgi:two-component system chemotaxis sensor kinase CheA
MDLNQKLLAAFQAEHVEHLERIRSMLAKLDSASADRDGSELDEAFRCAHSLKGAARIIGLSVVESLAHRLESLFARIRASTVALDKETLGVVHLTLDSIEDAAAMSFRGETSELPHRVVEELDRLLRAESTPVVDKPVSTLPPAEPPATREEPRQHGAARAVDSVRLSAEYLDRLLQSSAQLLTASLQQEVVAREMRRLAKDIAGLKKPREATGRFAAGKRRRNPQAAGTACVDQHDSLLEDRFHAISRRARAIAQLQQQNSWSHRLLAEQLRQDVRRARMVPAESVFQGFRKMMRDLAHDEGKELEFRMAGMEAEADRAVLQALKDPLMHVLRNAVSHGIEHARQRVAAGKPAQGQVALNIEAVGNTLIVAVEDDGRGIDMARVSQAAARQGLVSRADGHAWTDAELLRLLARPGFSTCDTVTELSGRGLGLTIANEAVSRLQGRIAMRPRDGGGTVVSFAVPMAVSTHRLLLVSCQQQTFGIPLAAIETVLRANRHAVESLEGRPMISLAGQLVPIVSLQTLLGLTGADAALEAENLVLMVLKSASRRIAVAVDALLVERDAVIQRIGPPAAQDAHFSGGIVQEDGSISLVLDPGELIERSKSFGVSTSCRGVAAEKQSPTILVVDDSVTTRTLETNILQSHGYQVRIAIDGLEALNQLRADRVDLVISDIQMPRLDGFGLLEAIKNDAQLSTIPVIIVSSMDSRDDQERGLRLGADAYIVKRSFDHQELLQTIQQIV